MKNIKTYQDAQVTLMRATPDPGKLIQSAMQLTMTKEIKETGPVSQRSLKFLVGAEHTSIIEQVTMTFSLEGVSRSFLAQITRHRIGSFTSASQHYADYRDMPMIVDEDMQHSEVVKNILELQGTAYEQLIDKHGIKPEEARQILPNAAGVNIIWSVNARSLLNFFRQRLCYRNVKEMQIVAEKVLEKVFIYWPGFATLCGPACHMDGKCNQGRMSCGNPWKRSE